MGGHTKTYGVDYDAIYAPVVDFDQVCIMLPIRAKEDLLVEPVDVKWTFFHREIDIDVYVRQPEGFEDRQRGSRVKVS